jgi:dienelactone hydrolase
MLSATGVLSLMLMGRAGPHAQAPPIDTAAFAYDARQPLDVRDSGVERRGQVSIHDISYNSQSGRVPAYLIVPDGKGPFAAIEFVHWGQGDRSEFLSEALAYAEAGAVSLLIDAPFNRPDFVSGASFIVDPPRDRATYVQLTVDARRGFDLLLARSDVDPARLGYVGHSLGATWGGALAGVEKRAAVYVLMGGLPNITDFSGTDTFSKEVREKYSREQIDRYRATVGPINPEHFVPHAAPARLYFQFAQWDRYISRAAAERYVQAASTPKVSRTYATSHEFTDTQSRCERATWLQTELRLGPAVLNDSACAASADSHSDASAARRLVDDYIRLYRRETLDEWKRLFLPTFTATYTNEDGTVTTRSLDDFHERQRRGFAAGEMSETLDHVTIEESAPLASAYADFEFTSGGSTRRGKLRLLMIEDRGQLKIAALTFTYRSR